MAGKKSRKAPAIKKKPRATARVGPQLEAARAARRVILARTTAGRAAIAALAIGADLSDVDHLPSVVRLPPREVEMPSGKKIRAPRVKRAKAAVPVAAASPAP